jgi:hypothetical protein
MPEAMVRVAGDALKDTLLGGVGAAGLLQLGR